MLRLSTYGCCALTFAGLLAARALRADVTEAAIAAGHELAQLADLLDGSETLLFNGERMHHASVYTDQDVRTVLDRFEAYCAETPSFLGKAMNELPADLAGKVAHAAPGRPARLGFVRDETAERGMVACFVDARPSGLSETASRLRRFLATSKISEFGQFRYAYAERTAKGGAHVVATWADTGLDLGAMFPSTGDAAGTDSNVLPRPPQARRTLAAAAEGHPYGLRVYLSRERADAVRAFYAEWMTNHGFRKVEDRGGTAAYLGQDGYQAFLSIAESAESTSVTMTEAGFQHGPNTAAVRAVVESP